jgi:HK97 family phage major capsid protein
MKTRYMNAAMLAAVAAAPIFDLVNGFDLSQIPRGSIFNDGKSSDPKEILNELQTTFNAFKIENDKLLEQVKKNGTESATTRDNVEKLNTKITELQNKLDEETKANKANEAAINRITLGGAGSEGAENSAEVRKHINAFNKLTGKKLDAEAYENFKKAQNEYWRLGEKKLGGETLNVLSVAADGDGYLVSPDISGRMIKKVYESSPLRELAAVQNTSKPSVEGIYDNDEVTVGWVGEDDSTARDAETDTADLGGWELKVHEMYAQPHATQNMLDDADFDVEAWLGDKVGAKLGRTEATAFVSGNGVKKPRGILSYTNVANASFTWGNIGFVVTGAATTFASSNPADVLFDAEDALKQAYREGAAWLMARSTATKIRKFKDGQGNYLWQPSIQVGQPATLLGYRLALGEDMPATGSNAFPIAFGNFKEAYQIVDRQGIRVLRDPFTKKGRVKFYTTKRVGGGVINFEALKLIKCST